MPPTVTPDHGSLRSRTDDDRPRRSATPSVQWGRRGQGGRRSSFVATDIPSTLRRPGVYRGALHEMVDQGAMFAPLVKKVMQVRRAADAGDVLACSSLGGPERRLHVRSTSRSRPTSCLPRSRDGIAAANSRSNSQSLSTRPSQPRAGARRDRCSRGDRSTIREAHSSGPVVEPWRREPARRGAACRAPGGSRAHHLPGSRTSRMRASVRRRTPAARASRRTPVGRGRPCRSRIGTDFDGMMTQNWRMPAPSIWWRSTSMRSMPPRATRPM